MAVLSAVSITAAAVATLAALRDHKPTALVATLVSCVTLTASLLVGLARR